MTNRAIVVLAVAATACLVLGARLLDAATTGLALIAAMVLAIGTALAATAVAGAWRTPAARPEPGSDAGTSHSPRPGSFAGPT